MQQNQVHSKPCNEKKSKLKRKNLYFVQESRKTGVVGNTSKNMGTKLAAEEWGKLIVIKPAMCQESDKIPGVFSQSSSQRNLENI